MFATDLEDEGSLDIEELRRRYGYSLSGDGEDSADAEVGHFERYFVQFCGNILQIADYGLSLFSWNVN